MTPVLSGLVRAAAEQHGQLPAIILPDRMLTYAQLEDAVERRAGVFGSVLAGGEHVALLRRNGLAFVVDAAALHRCGAVLSPLNPDLTAVEVASHLDEAEATHVVADDDLRPLAADALTAATVTATLLDPAARAAPSTQTRTVDDDDPALIQWSSGSSGRPKRVVRTHRQLRAEADHFHTTTSTTPDDVVLGAAPFFHAHGLGNALLAALRSGAALVPVGHFERAAIGDALERERVTILPGVPTTFDLLGRWRGLRDRDLGALRLAFSAGAPLTTPIVEAFLASTGTRLRQLYGCTEAGSMTIDLDDDPDASATVGRPMDGVDVRLEPLDGPDAARGEEIHVRSRALTTGYDRDPGATAASFRDGWFAPGDLGTFDDAGRLVITGRRTSYIATASHKVDPREVEAVLLRHDAVLEAVVVGVDGAAGSQVVKAVLVTRGSIDRGALIAFCRGHLAEFKIPRVVEFRDELPRSPIGKLLRSQLLGTDAT